MNLQQEKAINITLNGHNLLILDGAGTGKSYVLKEIQKKLPDNSKNAKITCSTWIACCIYKNACTINRFWNSMIDVLNHMKLTKYTQRTQNLII